jgi:hypothetical protein
MVEARSSLSFWARKSTKYRVYTAGWKWTPRTPHVSYFIFCYIHMGTDVST